MLSFLLFRPLQPSSSINLNHSINMIIFIKCNWSFNIKYILKFITLEAKVYSACLSSTFNQNISLDASNHTKHHVWQLMCQKKKITKELEQNQNYSKLIMLSRQNCTIATMKIYSKVNMNFKENLLTCNCIFLRLKIRTRDTCMYAHMHTWNGKETCVDII